MDIIERINAFSRLGERLQSLNEAEKKIILETTKAENPWFVANDVELALTGLQNFLQYEELLNWTSHYSLTKDQPKIVGVAMAGNIPLVGFHDLLTVLIAGHTIQAKLSHQDKYLMETIISLLIDIEPRFKSRIIIAEKLSKMDAVIATGSDNTSRYFEYYFRSIPHIIRKNRSSCAIILGEENQDDLTKLGHDVFSYFGKGCRNISKIYVPISYDFSELSKAFESFAEVRNHHKYMNNYDYQKAILILNTTPFLDNGFSLMRQETSLVSPLATLFYEHYSDQNDLAEKINSIQGKLQCITSLKGWYPKSIDFGSTQLPGLNDYSDDINTLQFLTQL